MNSKRVAYKDACILQGVLTLANILTQLLRLLLGIKARSTTIAPSSHNALTRKKCRTARKWVSLTQGRSTLAVYWVSTSSCQISNITGTSLGKCLTWTHATHRVSECKDMPVVVVSGPEDTTGPMRSPSKPLSQLRNGD
jgi:hypothetical protein